SVMTVLAVPVSKFLTVIDTPGTTAPDASCATPEIVPVVTCAETKWPLKSTLINNADKYRHISLSFFLRLPECSRLVRFSTARFYRLQKVACISRVGGIPG